MSWDIPNLLKFVVAFVVDFWWMFQVLATFLLLEIPFLRMFQVLGGLLAKGLFWGQVTLRRRELQNGPKWAYYLDETRMRRSPLPTIILYIEYIVCSTTTIISWGRRRDIPPARGHTTDWDLTPTPWEECTSSQRVIALSHTQLSRPITYRHHIAWRPDDGGYYLLQAEHLLVIQFPP